jgi:molybdenum-dependent DNA-binding transcriptional regulator ModE
METISMSVGERRRLEIFGRVERGELCLAAAGELLGLSYRQAKRVWRRFREEGDAGLVHRSRGRPSNRQAGSELKARVLELYRERYRDYGPTLAAECLAEEEKLEVSASTLRRWLVLEGLWEGVRKRRVHRRRRERREHLGELLQMDGSYHDWFEGRWMTGRARDAYAGWATLMVLVDDATSRLYARFYENESWESATDVFQRYVSAYGLPRSLYVDQHSIYRADREPTNEEICLGKEPETQFGRAMRELGVELILARSPQAKGRVERMNGTLQDRLVKAMRRAEISDLEAANAFLEEEFLAKFNERFEKRAAKRSNWHRRLDSRVDLGRILSIQETRVVQNDWTIRWRNRILQLPRESAEWVQPGDRVQVCEQLDGQVRVFAGSRELSWSEARSSAPARKTKASRKGPTGSSQGQKPSASHPWRGRRREAAAGSP